MFMVNIDEDNPWGTSLCRAIASSRSLMRIRYRSGAKVSSCTMAKSFFTHAMVGLT